MTIQQLRDALNYWIELDGSQELDVHAIIGHHAELVTGFSLGFATNKGKEKKVMFLHTSDWEKERL